jgi:hypothetical protein
LIRNSLAVALQNFTVVFIVNLSGTSIGAGFRAVLRNLIARDLSRTIDSWGAGERFTVARRDPWSAHDLKTYQTPQVLVAHHF